MIKLNSLIVTTVCAAAFVPLSLSAITQDSTQNKCALKIANASIYTGTALESYTNLSYANFQKLAPDLNSFPTNRNFNYSSDGQGYDIGGFNVGANIGLQFNKCENSSKKFKPELRFGLNYSSRGAMGGNADNTEKYRIDTLNSANSMRNVYLDSVYNNHCYISQSSKQIRLDASIIFRLMPSKQLSCYGGLGLDFGTAIRSSTHLQYSKGYHFEYTTPDSSTTSNSSREGNYTYTGKTIVNKNGMGGSIYIPIGLDFRLGNKRDFFKRIHLLHEIRPSINFKNTPELKSYDVSCGIKYSFGIKYYF
jgi:hypothetical protein